MSGFSKLGIILTSVFSILLLALLAELSYLLWRRRQHLRRKSNRIEPTRAPTPPTPGVSSHSEHFKLEGIYGPPSRVLFTIKEEEREEIENELASAVLANDRKKAGLSLAEHFVDFQFQHSGGDSPSSEVVIVVGEPDFEVEPPFLTPCTSPPYFTPSPSPTKEKN